ncbi:PAS domain S-box protein [Anabaena sp. UHCC 0253]|uniref:sensor histidine kinase n=1 Tax=Anabaena sp. UHCC 0253 TaxID=2590019 RepID=UPI001444E98F|nr:PAS domain S-box protein [Anabaena sp. UHCC 0253]MTJ51191.1 PAS domain S-box protein [Anabaena sp. UHCC 0253]
MLNPLGVAIGLFIITLFTTYYLLQRQITQRQQAENILRQQTERERLVSQIAHQIRKSLNLDKVLVTTVAEVKQFLQADRVLIYRLWEDGTGSAITETVSPDYPCILGETFPAEVFPREYHQAYTQGKTRAITDINHGDIEPCLAEFVKQFGVKAKLVVPILQEVREVVPHSQPYLWGLLIAHQCEKTREWQPWEVELMVQLANQVAIAIQQSELYEQLQELNIELENRVQQRTEELAKTNNSLRAEIVERKRTEVALNHTNQTLQSLIAASPRAIFTLDLNNNVKIWNPAAERMFGWTEIEVLDQPNPVISEDLEEYKKIKQNVIEGITPPSLEVSRYKKDGSLIDIVFSAAPLRNTMGIISGIVAVVADITERKRIGKALRRSEERFRSLIENALDVITILDTDGTIQYISPSVEKVLGYQSANLIDQNFFAAIHPDDFVTTCYHITNAIKNPDVPLPVEFRYCHEDGSWRTLEAISQKFVDDSELTRIVVNSRDITERKRLEEVRLALEKEKELSAMKIRFFSMASHEFRTPLSTALAAAQLLENSPHAWQDDQKRTRNLRRIQDSIKNMVQLLDDILTINRAETGNLEFNPTQLDLEKFCRQFVEEIRLSDGSEHIINFVWEGNREQAYLDEKLLRSILGNLLSNAIKYSPENTQVDFYLIFQEKEVIIKICDQGIGISINDQNQLFEPFHRGKNVRNIPGTGLGLMVVKKCVDLHGGSLNIMSESDHGTTVTVTLPII